MKKMFSNVFLVISSVIFLTILYSGYYIINENEIVIITRFGKPVSGPLNEAGIGFKWPWIDHAIHFDKRILEWDGDDKLVPTRDKKLIYVDTTARWRISDAMKFYERVHDEDGAQSQMGAIIGGHVSNEIGKNNLIEIVRDTNQLLDQFQNDGDASNDDLGNIEKIFIGREQLTRNILNKVKPELDRYGIELIDVRIKGLKYAESVLEKVFDRMISEQETIAQKIISSGYGKKAIIDGQLNLKLNEIESTAYMQAQQIKGQADAESTKIFAEALSKSPELYEFTANLDAIADVISNNGTLILSTDSEIFKIMKSVR